MKFFPFFAQNISEGLYICAKKGEISQKDLGNLSEMNPKLRLIAHRGGKILPAVDCS